jgi:hypothetical protein
VLAGVNDFSAGHSIAPAPRSAAALAGSPPRAAPAPGAPAAQRQAAEAAGFIYSPATPTAAVPALNFLVRLQQPSPPG